MKSSKGISLILSVILFSSALFPCTTFIYRHNGHLYFGRNLDWVSGTGLIMTNLKNLEKTALLDSLENPVKWISRYGSVTFNQVGRDLPFGGINEAGLLVEHMTLDETQYPERDNRTAVLACQWIQYQLDNFSTVEEVINSDTFLRITDHSKFHFLICDSSGHSAVIEFLDGKMVSYSGKDLPYEALANSTYDESLKCLKDTSMINTNLSLAHFSTAVNMINNKNTASPVDYAFSILNAVSQGLGTKWSIVYDMTDMKIYLKVFETPVIAGENKIFLKQPGECVTKIVDVKGFDFACSGIPKVLDLEYSREGLVNNDFVEYTTDINRTFISKAFTFYKGWGVPISLTDEELDYLSKYPESFKCN